jgi:sulfonate transport system substrate-binding protein
MSFFSTRQRTAAFLALFGLASLLPLSARADQTDTLHIGYQKYGTLVLLKAQGTLEKRLAPLGIHVSWSEFPGGPQLLEALNVGSVDLGTTGETPPIFAQAAGAGLLYVANEPPAPEGEGIVVKNDSPIKSVKDLKGKRIAFNKGSNVHYLIVRALENAGLSYADITPVYLNPSDGRAAFERGSVDAWAIWDPFYAAAEKQLGARSIVDGRHNVDNHQFYLASRNYASRNPKVLKIVVEELARLDLWSKSHLGGVASELSSQIGLDKDIVQLAAGRSSYGVQPIDQQVINEQQRIADTFYDLKLIPKKLSIKDAVWQAAH